MSDTVPSRASQLNAVFISFTVITVLFVALRLWIRINRRTLGADDYVLVFATVASIVQTVFVGIATLYGYGKPFKSLSKHDQVYSLLMFWICQLCYKCVTWPTKLSVLLLYRRIFGDTPGIRAWGLNFNWIVKVYLALICATFVCVEIVTIFACLPIARSWNKTIPGGCVQLVPWWYSYGAMNIFTDLTILLLPMPLIQRLEIPARQKAGLFAIFGLGGFVCVCTIVRITTIDRTSKSPDPTYGGVTTLIWTAVESNVGIICACLPLFRPLIVYIFPRFARTITKGGSYARHTGGDSKPKNSSNSTSQSRTMTENEPYTWRNWGKDENIIMTGVTAKRSNSTDSDIAINNPRDGITKVTHFHMTSEAASDTLSRKLDRESTLDDGRDLGDSQDSLNLPRQAV